MNLREQRWLVPWAQSLLALTAVACSGAPLGGARGTGGSGDEGGTGCTPSGSCVQGAGGIIPDAGNGSTCDQLAAKYAEVVRAAVGCIPGATDQCQALVGNVPSNCPDSECGNQSYVNDGASVEAVRQSWLAEGCGEPPNECITSGCTSPPPSVCVLVGTTGTSLTGTCKPASGTDAGESCDQLAADYQTALTAALACQPGAPNQCQAFAEPMLDPCNTDCGSNSISVNDDSGTSATWMRWVGQCASNFGCPLIVCPPVPPPPPGTCVPGGDAASAGTCVTGSAVTTN
jgi:hypothetical protein